MRAALARHVLRKPREKARMIVEIWAESGRNPRVAEFTRQLDYDVMEGMAELVELAKSKGVAAATLDARFASRVLFTLVVGHFPARRARARLRRRGRIDDGARRARGVVRRQLAPSAEA